MRSNDGGRSAVSARLTPGGFRTPEPGNRSRRLAEPPGWAGETGSLNPTGTARATWVPKLHSRTTKCTTTVDRVLFGKLLGRSFRPECGPAVLQLERGWAHTQATLNFSGTDLAREFGGAKMTGPDHYREAEALLDALQPDHDGTLREPVRDLLAKAQVHATLALAASLGLSADLPMPDQHAWLDVAV